MNPILLEILPLIKNGYCCSQLIMHLLLQGAGQENPQLIRAMHGLCFGLGGTEGPCGLLTGGACVLSCFAGRGHDDDIPHASLAPMIHEYQQWFVEYTKSAGLCHQVLEQLPHIVEPSVQHEHEHARCGYLLGACWEKILELLENYDVDMELKA